MGKNNEIPTGTHIRNFYADGFSYMMMSFFKTNLSFRFAPFISKDATGRSSYDEKKALMTTTNYEGAAALYIVANKIIAGEKESDGMILTIPCAGGASLTLERKLGQNGQLDTWFVISKNNAVIPFKFITHQVQVKENGQMVTKIIQAGLGAFAKTIEGYLTGINASRHLNKLPDDFDEMQQIFNTVANKYQENTNEYQKPNYGNNQNPYSSYQNTTSIEQF